ncbi:MAG: hypothetical protein GXY84_01665 [Clostridiales bacterium]|nr:hypothetical protein [Clostridiales bacterium]
MAKLEQTLTGSFDRFVDHIHEGIISGSISASFEDGSDWQQGDTRVAVRVYERYSWIGSNRVSLSVTIVGQGERLFISAVTSGGSQAVFFKINTFGEQSFLSRLEQLVRDFR